ncbi:MAG: hypothetical protein ABI083_03255 [Lapillicoccus sp.]
MSSARVILAAAGAAAITVVAALGSGSASAASQSTDSAQGVSKAGTQVVVRAGTALATPTYVAADPGKVATATFSVTYTGFTPAAKASFQRAVNYWATQVTSSVPITIDAKFSPLGTGILGSAGPSSVWRDFAGAPQPGTWYVDAIANKRAGRQLGTSADITAQFSSNFSNWFYGTGPAPKGKYDFQSVVTHELGHGLGFLGAGRVTGSSGSVKLSGLPIAYDRFTETGAGKKLLSLPDNSVTLAKALQSGNVVFDQPGVRSANGGKPAKLYAPSAWQQGSSYSHLDEATFRAGNPNSLMTPAIGSGESIRSEGPIMKAIFSAIGW